MNQIYRLSWSRITQCWVAVAEISRGRGHGAGSKFAAAALTLSSALAQAAPDGGQVLGGAGSITQSGSTTTIDQSSQSLSLNWKSFNISPTETVNFVQPSASAIAVNRINDTQGTQILGRLNANGQVYLINPNGILFGQGAQVNVGALVASTLELSNTGLSGNTATFSGNGTGTIVNKGLIKAAGSGGYVALLGNTVGNLGTIDAPLGAVALGAGSAVTLSFQNSSLVKMQVDQSVLNSQAENGGLIRADGGLVLMSAGAKQALLASVVNNTGVIEARTVENHAGTIVLLGGMAAGTVNVSGTLDARAPAGGNGGLIETSAAHVKIANGTNITTTAPRGKAGTWWVDPTDFTIAAAGGDITGAALGDLLNKNNVVLQTDKGRLEGLGDIVVNDSVTWEVNNKLTLNAHRNININQPITAANGSLALLYGQGTSAAGNTATYKVNAAVNLSAGPNFSTTLGADGTAKAFTVITSLGAAGSISTTDLQGMSGNAATHYALGSNIDAAATAGWNASSGFAPINGFSGTLDGLGHSIGNLVINRPGVASVGLIGTASAGVIQNIGLTGGSTIGGAGTGALLGSGGTSTVTNSYATGNVTGAASTGGLVGTITTGNITGSRATGNVTGAAGTGGLVGTITTGNITNSRATGNVTGAAGTGGLVGTITTGSIIGSYATGNVNNGAAASVGGLLGSGTTGSISSSYARGNVTGGAGAGGLVGDFTTGSITNSYAAGAVSGGAGSGGLAGTITTGNITNTYATGSVSGAAGTGGLVGVGTTGIITNSYASGLISGSGAGRGGLIGSTSAAHVSSFWDVDGTGMTTSTGGTGAGMTTGQLQTQANFTSPTSANKNNTLAWDLGNTWVIYDGLSMPLLRSFLTPLTVSVGSVGKTYDGLAYNGSNAVSYTTGNSSSTNAPSNMAGVLSYGGSALGASNAGSYAINLSGLSSNQQGYLINYAPGVLTIAQAPVSISGTRSYDGTNLLAASIFSLNGVVKGQDLTFSGVGSMSDNNVGGSKAVSLGSLTLRNGDTGLSSNYTLTGGTRQVQVNAAALTITAGNLSKTYDGTLAVAGTGSVTSGVLFGRDALSAGGLAFTDKNVGDRNKTVTANGVSVLDGNAGANYQVTYVSNTSSSIAARALNVVARAADKVYDGNTTASVALSDNRVGGDVLTLSLKPSLTGSSTSGTYISITNANGETTQIVSGSAGSSGANFADKNAALDKTVLVTGIQVQGVDAGNYLANTTALSTASISPKALTVLATGKTKVYDGNTAGAVTLSSSGIAKGDNLRLAGTGLFSDANAGTAKTVAVTGIAASGSDAGNYTLGNTVASTTASITPKSITVTASGTNKVYDGSTSTNVALSSSGVLAQDLGNVQFSGAAAFSTKDVGIGKTVAVSNIEASGSQAGNYQVKNNKATAFAAISAKAITVTANGIDKVYNGNTAAAVVLSSNGLVNGDSVNFASANAVFSDKNADIGKQVSISGIRLSGADGKNYIANTDALGTANITPKSIAVTATAGSMVYSAALDVPVSLASSGVIRGDNVSFASAAAMLDTKNVGTNKLVSVSGITAMGVDARNYMLSNSAATAQATVTPKSITVAATAASKAFDGTSDTTATFQTSGMIAGDLLSFTSASVKFSSSAAGTNKMVTVSGVNPVGADASNYAVAKKTIITTATITPR